MRLTPSDPDIATIASRIKNGDLDLQPNFQRGEVWSEIKKRRLIDTILRQWHVPPIHVIVDAETSKQEVLDGQQRLAAIRDFVRGYIRVDGFIEPIDASIKLLHDRTYEDLPADWRRKFDQFTIRVFNIVDYKPEEPAELFYRLNQPANLTAPEQRNAFFGPARDQVKSLVTTFEEQGLEQKIIGFSNSRMAYDDVVSRLCFALEKGTITEKITSSLLTDRYRSSEPFPDFAQIQAKDAIFALSASRIYWPDGIRLNKATVFSWLWFISQANKVLSGDQVRLYGTYLRAFETYRNISRSKEPSRKREEIFPENTLSTRTLDDLIHVYNDRATARVSDVSSVLTRDIVIWTLFLNSYVKEKISHPAIENLLALFHSHLVKEENWVDAFIGKVIESNWGLNL